MIPQTARSAPNALDDARIADRFERYRSLLGQAPLFRGLGATALDDLARRMQVRTRPAGAVVVTVEEPGDSLFLIADGRVRVVLAGASGRELVLSTLSRGDFFGETALLDGRPRSASVTAVEPTTLLVLSREAFADHLRNHPQTALNLLGEMARRLRRADETIANLALRDVEERLLHTLERMAREEGEAVGDGLLVRRRPTQQELANMVGACRETVSRTFTSLAKRGLIVPRGRSLVLTRQLLGARAQ